jgi:HD-GYP domain-containing protein (c-di-GMP phosphodiesterase class II)
MTSSQAGHTHLVSSATEPSDADIRRDGRHFLLSLSTAFRSLQLYPTENEQAQRALDDLTHAAATLLEYDAVLEVRVVGDILFVNGVRLRGDLDSHASFANLLGMLKSVGVGHVKVEDGIDRAEWVRVVQTLLSAVARKHDPEQIVELRQMLIARDVHRVFIDVSPEDEREIDDKDQNKELAKRTYQRSVAVTKEVVNSVRMGRSANVKKVKRAVQGIVDQVLNNEVSLVGLTTIRDYDEYTFTHSVNVCIFAIALGKRMNLTKLQLYDLGMAALLHDVGKSRVPLNVLNKTSGLDEDEWQMMQAHPWMGLLTLFRLRGYGEIPYRSMVTAYEHHMKVDLSGYPKAIRPRTPTLYSKIVAVADGFDAATSRRSYQTTPIHPDQVLREMWENPRRGYDRVLVKELINLVGIYPVGTCVILSTHEVALVHTANPHPEQLNRPIVRVVLDASGEQVRPGTLVDLSDVDENGDYIRSILRVTDITKYGVDPVEYFT